MNAWVDRALDGGVAVVLVLAVMAYVVVHVFTSNFVRLRRRLPEPELLSGERRLDEIAKHSLLTTSRLVLTDRRVVIQRLHWPFTSVSQGGVALGDVQSVSWMSGLNVVLLVAAAVVFPFARPFSLLLLMAAMEQTICSVSFVVAHSVMPFSRPGLVGFGRAALPAFHRFHRSARLAWSAVRAAPAGVPHVPAPVGEPAASDAALAGFRWGVPVWAGTLAVMAAAVLQRLATEAVSYDHVVFAPLFLGLPLAVAKRSVRDGAWAGLLSVLAVFSVKFPAIGLSQGHAFPLQVAMILAGVLVMSVLAGVLAAKTHALAAALPLLLWPAVVAADGGRDALDLRTAAVTLLAMAVVAAVPGPAGEPPAPARVFTREAEVTP